MQKTTVEQQQRLQNRITQGRTDALKKESVARVSEMAQRTRKFVVAPAKLDSMFTTTIAIVAETFAAGKFSGKITEQILT